MATPQQLEVGFRITADDATKAATSSATKRIKAMGTETKKMSVGAQLGFRSVTNAAERLGQGLGVQTAYLTDLSQAFENQASKGIPRWLMAVGGAALGVGALVLAVKSVIDQQKKMREQLEKSVETLRKETSALWAGRDATDAQRKSRERLFEITRRQFLLETPKLIRLQEKEFANAEERLNEIITTGGGFIFKSAQQRDDFIAAEMLKVEKSRAELNSLRADLARARNIGTENTALEIQNNRKAAEEAIKAARRGAQQQLKIKEKEAADEIRINQLRQQSAQMTARNFAVAFRLMADLGGKHGRKMFSAYKLAAAGEVVISTANAAMAALTPSKGLGPVLGWGLATAIALKGAAQLAMINKQKYDGGGGGIQSIGTFPANPATGIPETAAPAPNLTVIINGQTMEIGQITGDMLQRIYDSNNSVNGLTVDVRRSE